MGLPHSIVCSSSSSKATWLGGKDPDMELWGGGFLSTYYANDLDRGASKVPDIPSGFYFPDKDVEETYRQVWAGDFAIVVDELVMQGRRGVMLSVHVREEDTGVPGGDYDHLIVQFDFIYFLAEDKMLQLNTAKYGLSSPAFLEFTSETMKQALYRQILHQIVRQHGHTLEPNDAELLCDHLLYSYQRESNKAYAYALDVIVAQLDSILARGGKRSRNNSITDEALLKCYVALGPLLQACGKFRLAGLVFEAVADIFVQPKFKLHSKNRAAHYPLLHGRYPFLCPNLGF
jgi:hypothetical protein